MLGLAGVLASAVTVVVAFVAASQVGGLAGADSAVMMLVLLVGLAAHIGLWFLAFSFFCRLFKVR